MALEEVDGCGLESLFFSKKYIRIIPLESITQLKIPIHVSQHKSCHIWLYFLSFFKILSVASNTLPYMPKPLSISRNVREYEEVHCLRWKVLCYKQ